MKRKFLHFAKITAIRLAFVAVFVFLILALVLWQRGVYDFTFIDRKEPAGSGTDTQPVPPDTDPLSHDTKEPEPRETETLPTDDPGQKEPGIPDTAAGFSASLPQSADMKEYTLMTGGEYSASECILSRLKVPGTVKQYAASDYDRRIVTTTEYDHGCFYSEETTETVMRPGLLLKNGYIIRDNGDRTLSLLNSDGTVLLKNYNESEFRLTEQRDENGRPLFCTVKLVKEEVPVPILEKDEYTGRMLPTGEFEEEPEEITVEELTYYILSDEGKWVLADVEDEEKTTMLWDRGLLFDAPTGYGESDCDLVRYTNGYSWGYKSRSTGQPVVYPRFRMAYNFHDGYAVAYDPWKLYFLDESGNIVTTVNFDLPEQFITFNEVTYPDTHGIESIGTYYFDHGYTRVRIRENLYTYQHYSYIKSADYQTLLDPDGNRFPIPGGYLLEGYSDGILLLKQQDEDVYGYMNYKGEWIAQPEYTEAHPFLGGLAAVCGKDGKWGMIDTSGTPVIPFLYTYISDFSSGSAAVYSSETGWEVYQVYTK